MKRISLTKASLPAQGGFTLKEALVVTATVAILIVMALPVLSRGREGGLSVRAMCASQIRQIDIAMTAYAQDNNGYFLSTRGGGSFNQRAFNPTVPGKYAADLYFATNMTNGLNKIWCCPSCYGAALPAFYPAQGEWLIGYNYYGGIGNWVNAAFPAGTPSYSPVKLSQSHSDWVLTTDCMNKYIAGTPNNWAIGNPLTVPHRRPGTMRPDGGNEGFVDGSVTWVKLETTLQLTEVSATYEHDFMYQNELPPAFTSFVRKGLAPPDNPP